MTRLMCSRDRQEVETLKSKLFRAGIRSEIRSNPLAYDLGFTQLDIFIDERDLVGASKVRQGLETVVSADDAPGGLRGGRRINGFAKSEEPELATDAEVLPSPSAETPQEENPGHGPETGGAEPEGEFAQATALLEKEVEELLVRDSKLADRCSSLEEKVKALDESLAQAGADLASEVSNRSSAEKKLAEVCEARASLEKEMQALEVRFNQQAQQLEQLLRERRDEHEQMRACLGKVNDLRSRVRAKLAAKEKQ